MKILNILILSAATCLLMSCTNLFYYDRQKDISLIPGGIYKETEFTVNLPQYKYSWELFISPGIEQYIIQLPNSLTITAEIVNLSSYQIRIAPITNSFINIKPLQKTIVSIGNLKKQYVMNLLFGVDTHLYGASLLVKLNFDPPIELKQPLRIIARRMDSI